jgi:hypothetical protein
MSRFLISALLLAVYSAAFACECGWVANRDGKSVWLDEPPPLSMAEVKGYAAIFMGKVIRIETDNLPSKMCKGCFTKDTIVTFEATSTWKGVADREYAVRTPGTGPACGYSFELGVEYLVYVKKGTRHNNYGVERCSRTKRAAEATDEIEFLSRVVSP